MMKLIYHVLNSILPYYCPCCESNLMEPFMLLCPECNNYFEKNIKLKTIIINELPSKHFINPRAFYFTNLFYLGYYTLCEKSVFQKAKFQNDSVMQSLLQLYINSNTRFLENKEIKYLIPAPSSNKIIEYFINKLAKHYKIPIKNVYKKRKKQQSKKLDQFARFREINANITLKSSQCLTLKSSDKILIFDDLWTTGATINHLCKLLVDDGILPEQIHCMVLFIRPKISSSF